MIHLYFTGCLFDMAQNIEFRTIDHVRSIDRRGNRRFTYIRCALNTQSKMSIALNRIHWNDWNWINEFASLPPIQPDGWSVRVMPNQNTPLAKCACVSNFNWIDEIETQKLATHAIPFQKTLRAHKDYEMNFWIDRFFASPNSLKPHQWESIVYATKTLFVFFSLDGVCQGIITLKMARNRSIHSNGSINFQMAHFHRLSQCA